MAKLNSPSLPSIPADATPAELAIYKVQAARLSLQSQSLPLPKPEPKRKTTAEKLSRNEGHTRERIQAPFTLIEETIWRETARLDAENENTVPEPPIKPTRLDNALQAHEKEALSQYVTDMSAASARSGQNFDRGSSSPSWGRLPFNPITQDALARLAYVHKYLTIEDRHELHQFTAMLVPISDSPMTPMTSEELGRQISGVKDWRIAEGVFVGTMRKLAQRLHTLYRNYAQKTGS